MGEADRRTSACGRRLSVVALGDLIARVNARLNFTSFTLLVAGLVFVRKRDLHRPRHTMTGAIWTSSLFLVFYLTRVALTGTHSFAGTGLARTACLGILISHMVLAVTPVPLVLRMLWLARHHRFRARWARWTYPIWL